MRLLAYRSIPLSVPCVFWKFEVRERLGLKIGGRGTVFPCILWHFNHWHVQNLDKKDEAEQRCQGERDNQLSGSCLRSSVSCDDSSYFKITVHGIFLAVICHCRSHRGSVELGFRRICTLVQTEKSHQQWDELLNSSPIIRTNVRQALYSSHNVLKLWQKMLKWIFVHFPTQSDGPFPFVPMHFIPYNYAF